MVIEVRQRVTREQLGRRGTTREQVWVNRRMLLTGADHLSDKQWRRLENTLEVEDPTKEIAAAWAVKERLRMLLGETEPDRIRRRLFDFYNAAADAHLDEATRLARTIDTWWAAILVALTEDVTNARTEGFHRIIKQTKRIAYGFTNMTTTNGASWSTSPSPDSGPQHDEDIPRKVGEPVSVPLPSGSPLKRRSSR